MKICIVARSLSKDYRGSFEFDQALSLCNEGHKVCLISLDLRSVLRKRQLGVHETTEKGVKIVRISIPLGAINKRVFYRISINAFKKVFKRENEYFSGFDIVHAHFLDNIYIVTKALGQEENRPVLVGTEHSNVTRIKKYKNNDFMTNAIYYSYQNVDKLITVSKSLSDDLMKAYNIKSDVIYNVVDTTLFKYDKCVRKNSSNTVFCSVGNLTKNKRMDLLIQCFNKAFGNNDRYILYICGGGEEEGRLKNYIKRLGCQNNIKLLGNVSREKIFDVFQNSDFFILLSERETFGVAFIEAMSSGLPVLSTKSGGPEEFITEKVGVLIEDEEKIVTEIKKIVFNREKYDREYISNYVYKRFSPVIVAKKLESLYLDNMDKSNTHKKGIE